MENLLIKFSANYADEFNLDGFIVMSEENWEAYKIKVAAEFDQRAEIEIYFGSNESIIYESLESYLRAFSIQKISDIEYSMMKKLFGGYDDNIAIGVLAMI